MHLFKTKALHRFECIPHILILMDHFYFTYTARGQKTYGFLHTSHSTSTLQLYQIMSSRKAQNNEKWPFLDSLQIRFTNSYKIKQLHSRIQQTSISILLLTIIHNMQKFPHVDGKC